MSRLAFWTWLGQADRQLLALCGLTHLDLADQTWRDWYEDGVTAAEAARSALEDEGFPFGEGE